MPSKKMLEQLSFQHFRDNNNLEREFGRQKPRIASWVVFFTALIVVLITLTQWYFRHW